MIRLPVVLHRAISIIKASLISFNLVSLGSIFLSILDVQTKNVERVQRLGRLGLNALCVQSAMLLVISNQPPLWMLYEHLTAAA